MESCQLPFPIYFHTWGIHTRHAKLLQRINTSRLKQLAHDPVRLLHALLQQYHAPALLAECDCRRASHDASAHNNNIRLMVFYPPPRSQVCGVCGVGRGDLGGGCASCAQARLGRLMHAGR